MGEKMEVRFIEPGFEILDWSKLHLYQRCEQAARVCYNSQPSSTVEESGEFVRKRILQGHLAVLEFARLQFSFGRVPGSEGYSRAMNMRHLYEMVNRPSWHTLNKTGIGQLLQPILQQFPCFLAGIDEKWMEHLAKQAKTSPELAVLDDYIPVIITCNRATSHQLVRHRLCSFMQQSQRYVKYRDVLEFIMPPKSMPDKAFCVPFRVSCLCAAEKYEQMLTEHHVRPELARLVLPNATATRLLIYASPKEWLHIFTLRCDKAADESMRQIMIPLRNAMQERGLI